MLGVVVLGEYLAVRGSAALVLTVAVSAMAASTIALGRDQGSEANLRTGRLAFARETL